MLVGQWAKRSAVLASKTALMVSALVSVTACAVTPSVNPQDGEKFDYAWLKGYAKNLSEQPYESHQGDVPSVLSGLDWDEYQQLHFKREESLWQKEDTAFRAGFFHLGQGFVTPVQINVIEDGEAEPVEYDADMFDYGKTPVNGNSLPKDLGFAGFRMQYGTDWERDIVAFLGASYFRAVGAEMQYGLSARGLAIDTAMNKPEEFPVFTHFWFEKPKPGADEVTIYALMDSDSITGAYRFDIKAGEPLTMRVDSALYPRKEIERLGVAPLTSMYMIGENDRRTNYDWRPEIHDSDGLEMLTGNGDWIWRPLGNPEQLRFNAYMDENPQGFGLMQRDRNFDHYLDDGVFYEKRPSLWIEPIGNWGKGSVQLVEIPTLDETFDNIVAFWNPAEEVKPGQELLYSYNMYWGSEAPFESGKATVQSTYTGIGGVVGKKREYYSKRFAIDFEGEIFDMLGQTAKVKPVIETSRGRVEITSARPQHHIGGYRAMFDLVPLDESQEPINIKVHLEANGQVLSETWQYQWTPPAAEDRELYNAGHLK
ncbi:glucan biosynthesis protein D [Marinomonas ostreistagni]|nr:glucan biosynthesis protein D [Marinomonas ostreistagni]